MIHCFCERCFPRAPGIPPFAQRAVCRSSDLNVRTPSRQRAATRLLSIPLQDFNDPLSRYAPPRRAEPALRSYSYKSDRFGLTRVRELHPIPLFSENKSCVSGRKTGSRICHKSRNVFSLICGYLCDDYYNHMFRLPSSPFRTAMRFFYDRARGAAHSARKPAPSSRKV